MLQMREEVLVGIFSGHVLMEWNRAEMVQE